MRVLLGFVALNWLGLLLKAARGRRGDRFRISPEDEPLPSPAPAVTVVIPARNEEANIGPCLEAVLAQDHEALQVVVFDDGSTDGTAAAVERHLGDERLRLVRGEGEPPADWFGKPWALQRAQRHARTPWLLFLDADVRLHPRAVSRALAYAVRHELKMLSGYGQLVTETFWERVLQPVVGGIIIVGNDLDEVNDPEREDKAMANGQFILFERQAYDSIGQHGAVQRNVLDDVGLATAAKMARLAYHCVFMRTLFSCRMYGSFSEIWRGWRKNLFAGMHYSWSVILVVTSYLALANLLPWLLLVLAALGIVGVEWLFWGAGLILLIQAVRFYLDRLFGQSPLYGPTQLLGVSLLILLMLDSAWSSRRGKVSWKGRQVDVRGAPAKPEGGSSQS